MTDPLPISPHLDAIKTAVRSGAAVVTAPPGSGKTTLVPPVLLDDLQGEHRSVILVQPRRLAARSVAAWIAKLRACQLGQEVGYQVRFDDCTSKNTRLYVVTTGILLRRLHDNPLLEGVGAVILDEFHERSVEMDLALGMMVRLRQTLRDDLRLCVMSATLETHSVAQFLESCPVIHAEGRRFPVEVRHLRFRDNAPLEQLVENSVLEAIRETSGHVLVFLPGVGEIFRCRDTLANFAEREGLQLLSLFGDLPPEQQDAVMRPSQQRKIILATNVAETSVTIDGVTAVVDSGLARQTRFNPDVGLPRLELVPISKAAAEQRAGRAGRTAPGICWRLWDQGTHSSRPAGEVPEIHRQDLAEAVLQLCAWGERETLQFPWLSPPTATAVESAKRLLRLLNVIDQQDYVTEFGRLVVQTPAHPRLAALIHSGAKYGVLREASIAAALLSERDPFRAAARERTAPRDLITRYSASDLVDRVMAIQLFHQGRPPADDQLTCHAQAARNLIRSADQFFRLARSQKSERAADPETALRRALLDAFPDRVAKLRTGSTERGVMVGGKGIRLEASSRVRNQPLFLCLDVNDAAGEVRVRMASAVEREWLQPPLLHRIDEVFFNPSREQAEARRRVYWLDLMLEEAPTEISDPTVAAELLAKHAKSNLPRVLPADDSPAAQFRQRVRWLANSLPDLGLPTLDDPQVCDSLPALCYGLRSLEDLRQANWLEHWQQMVGYERLLEVERLAPAKIEVPSGNKVALTYDADQPPVLAVRIQELFGLAETPRVGGGRIPVLLHLLGPNYRPQQVTSDLASFWKNTYPQVKKELKRRYPKHSWPDEPASAPPSRSGLNRDVKKP